MPPTTQQPVITYSGPPSVKVTSPDSKVKIERK